MSLPHIQAQLWEYATQQAWNIDTPVQVGCRLLTPAALSGHVCLDSLLGRAVWFEALGDAGANVPQAAVPYEIPLPLARVGSVWAASAVQFAEPLHESVTRYRRRWCEEYETLAKLPRKLITFGFDFKDRDIPVPLVTVSRLHWYAKGDLAAIQRLISTITYIGKRHGAGTGRVGDWTVSEMQHDWSVYRHGTLMRPVPLEEVEDCQYDRGYCAITNPYWHSSNYRNCAVPPIVTS